MLECVLELKNILNLSKASRIESFDNSHLFGTYYVGGMVVFENFLPLKNEYRKFKIDAHVNDDYHAMKEVIYRRYYHVIMEDLVKPDLIVVDGGEIQVEAVLDILTQLNLKIPVIGLKKDSKHHTNSIINQNL